MFYNVIMFYTASEIPGTVQIVAGGVFPGKKAPPPLLSKNMIWNCDLQEVRYVDVCLYYSFCS